MRRLDHCGVLACFLLYNILSISAHAEEPKYHPGFYHYLVNSTHEINGKGCEKLCYAQIWGQMWDPAKKGKDGYDEEGNKKNGNLPAGMDIKSFFCPWPSSSDLKCPGHPGDCLGTQRETKQLSKDKFEAVAKGDSKKADEAMKASKENNQSPYTYFTFWQAPTLVGDCCVGYVRKVDVTFVPDPHRWSRAPAKPGTEPMGEPPPEKVSRIKETTRLVACPIEKCSSASECANDTSVVANPTPTPDSYDPEYHTGLPPRKQDPKPTSRLPR